MSPPRRLRERRSQGFGSGVSASHSCQEEKMILIPTTELEEGMVVAKEIRGKDQSLLLRKGAQLTPTSIQLLQLLHVNGVYIDVEGTEDIQVEDIVAPEVRTECQRTIERAMNGFQRQAGARKLALDGRMVEQATYDMVEQL